MSYYIIDANIFKKVGRQKEKSCLCSLRTHCPYGKRAVSKLHFYGLYLMINSIGMYKKKMSASLINGK